MTAERKIITVGDIDVYADHADKQLLAVLDQIERDEEKASRAAGRNVHEQIAYLLSESVLPNMKRLVKTLIVNKAVLDEDLAQIAENAGAPDDDDLRLDEEHVNRLVAVLTTVIPLVDAVLESGGLPPDEKAKTEHLKQELLYFKGICDEMFDEDEDGEEG